MTKHWNVNKCKWKEKDERAALIRQANIGVWNGQRPKIYVFLNKKKECMVEEKGRKEKNLKRRRQEIAVSNVTKVEDM